MRFIESIRVEKGSVQLLSYHQRRIEQSLIYLGSSKHIPSAQEIATSLLEMYKPEVDKIYKLRFVYDTQGVYDPSLSLYKSKAIHGLHLAKIDTLDCYAYKWQDRTVLSHPLIDAEHEVIFMHQGYITDTSFSNIVLEMEDGQMLSPRRPLLRGLMRQYLLDRELIALADLREEDLKACQRIHLINAMLPLGRLSLSPKIIV